MKHVLSLVVSAGFAAAFASQVCAASVIYDPISGEARGITDLDVNGASYDVAFVSGSYDGLYNVDPPEFFGDDTGALDAAIEIVAVFLAEPSKPLLYNLLNPNESSNIWIPYGLFVDSFGTERFSASQLGANFLANWGVSPSFAADRTRDFTFSHPGWKFAKFGAPGSFTFPPPVPTVPLPAGGLLLMSALAALGLRRLKS